MAHSRAQRVQQSDAEQAELGLARRLYFCPILSCAFSPDRVSYAPLNNRQILHLVCTDVAREGKAYALWQYIFQI